MTLPGQRLLGVVARALEPAERDVVLGDVAESGQGICTAIWHLLGLIVRRQVGLWAVWRPWLALLGVSGIAGLELSGIAFRLNVDLGQQLMAHHHGVRFETGLTAGQDMAFLLCLALGLMVWSWTCGFALGSLSGRAVWVTWSVFYLVVLDSRWASFVLSGNIILRHPQPFLRLLMAATLPLSVAALLFSVPAILGALMGVRRRVLPVRHAYLLGSAVTVLTILTTWMTGWYETAHETWSGGVWRGVSSPMRLLPFLLASWPAVYLLTEAYRQHTKEEKTI